MQSLHRGSFCAQIWRETRRSSDAKRDERAEAIWRDTRQNPWNFSPYLRLVYHKALSGTYQKIHQVSAKGVGLYLQEDFWLENAYIKETVVRDVQKSQSDHRRCLQAR